MEISFDFITFIHLAAVLLGIVSSGVILYFGIRYSPYNQPLGIGQLSISLGIFVSFTMLSKLIVHWPFLYRLGNVFILVFVPMPYLYTVFYTRKRLWKWYDLIHAIPLLIYLVDYWDVLSLSNAEKTRLILQEINDLNLWEQFRQSKYIGPGFHMEFRMVLFSVYWIAQVVVLVKWLRNNPSLTRENKIWRNGILVFLVCQFFIWFPFYLSLIWLDKLTSYNIVNYFAVAWLMITSFIFFFFPSLLYGRTLNVPGETSRITKVLQKHEPTKEEENKLNEVFQLIKFEMEKKMLFLTEGYSINDFSSDIDIPVYQISKCLNTIKGIGFVDFINQRRIQYCVGKFEQGEWQNFTLEAVARECGFTNRNSFTKSFKKFMNCSPSEYRDALRLQKVSKNGG
jgi:AraC-like DNA-binding protein